MLGETRGKESVAQNFSGLDPGEEVGATYFTSVRGFARLKRGGGGGALWGMETHESDLGLGKCPCWIRPVNTVRLLWLETPGVQFCGWL